MSGKLISQVEEQRHHVIVDSYTITWNELINQYRNKDVSIDPLYQRAFRWAPEQQTKYIESLLLNIPTPPIFFSEDHQGRFEVIDGLQRVSTIIKFFAEEIFGEDIQVPSKSKNDENNIRISSVLTDAPILTDLVGLSRDSFPETLLRTLRYSRIHVILLKKESSDLAKYNVFTRLNRAGTSLSNQEIRNCSARLFDSDFPDRINELSQKDFVKKSLGLSRKDSSSMGEQENILRLVAFGNFKPKTQRLEEFLDETMYFAASKKIKKQNEMLYNVEKVFDIVYAAFPNGEAFKFLKNDKFSGAFSPNLYDIIACGIYKNLKKCTSRSSEEMRDLIFRIHKEESALKLTGAGSNAKSKMIGRVEFGMRWFS
jgi:hypothetical protein